MLQLPYIIGMATTMVSFDLVFYKLSENVTFADIQQGEQGFSFLNGDCHSKINLKTMNRIKTLTMVSMETKVVSRGWKNFT